MKKNIAGLCSSSVSVLFCVLLHRRFQCFVLTFGFGVILFTARNILSTFTRQASADLIVTANARRSQQQQQPLQSSSEVSITGALASTKTKTSLSLNASSWIQPRAFDRWNFSLPCFESHPELLNIRRYQEAMYASHGFLYMKPRKCGSTTAASVNLRIARNVARRVGLVNRSKLCDNRFTHGDKATASSTLPWKKHRCERNDNNNAMNDTNNSTNNNEDCQTDPNLLAVLTPRRTEQGDVIPYRARRFRHRIHEKSFLWTIIREPTERYISHYFFQLGAVKLEDESRVVPSSQADNEGDPQQQQKSQTSRNTTSAAMNDDDFRRWLFQRNPVYYYLCTLSPFIQYMRMCGNSWNVQTQTPVFYHQQKLKNGKHLTNLVINETNMVLKEYDFIGLVERFDESLVVLKMLLGLELSDILYLSGKVSGGLVPLPSLQFPRKFVCGKTRRPSLTDHMRAFFESQPWQRHVLADRLLYEAVNRSLDLTIDHLGRSEVERNLALFQQANQLAADRCKEPTVRFACHEPGRPPRNEKNTDCYVRDLGCGMACLDSIAEELGLGRTVAQM